MYTANFAIPLVGTWMAGGASIAMFYMYLLGFDLMNIIGHCNFEFFPVWPFQARTTLSLSLVLLLRLRACICSTSARALC